MNKELDAYERWMVRSNLERIRDEGLEVADVVSTLRANGYPRIADAVEQAIAEQAIAEQEGE
jgi:hypothetical protein